MIPAEDARVRHAIYRHFADTGGAPSVDDLGAALGVARPTVAATLRRLADQHLLALDADGEVWMAHPFSARDVGYAVEANGRTYQANCAWDALALPPLLGANATIRATCPDCRESLKVSVHGDDTPGDLLVHFVVPPARFWDDIGYT